MGGRNSQGVWDGHVHTAIFKMDNQQGPTVQHRELCSMLYGSLNGKRVRGRMDTCMCMAESPCCPPETITILLIDCTPIQTKKLKKKQKKTQRLPTNPRGWKGQERILPLSCRRKCGRADTLISDFQPPQPRDTQFVLSHSGFGTWLQQPWETNISNEENKDPQPGSLHSLGRAKQ